MADKQVLFELNVDISQSIEQMAKYEQEIGKVTEEISKYQKMQKEGTELSASEQAELIRLKEVKKALQKEYSEQSRQVQNAIVAEGQYKDTLKGLCAELSIAKDKLRAMKEAGSPDWQRQAEEVNSLNERIKQMEESYGVHTRNVGNYSSSFVDAFSKMGGSTNKIINPIKNVTLGLKTMSATPVIAILGLLANIITMVMEKLKSSEDNLNAVNKSMSAFGVIGDAVTAIVQALGKAVAWLADGFMKVLDKLGLVTEAMKQRQAIAEAEIQLAKQQRDTIVQNADDELKAAELRAKTAEKTKYTEQERLEFLKQTGELEAQISQRAYEDAKLQYEIIKAKNALTDSSAEEKKAEADAYANMIKAQTSYFNKTREINSQIAEAQKSARDKEYTNWEKTFNAINKLRKALLDSKSTYLKDWSKTEEENAAAEFEHNQKYAMMEFVMEQKQQKELLKKQLAYGKITATQYQQELKNLAQQMDNFMAKQANELFDFQKEAVENAINLAGGKMLDQKLADIRTKYKLSEEAIKNDAQMTEEEKSYYLLNLAKSRNEEIKATTEAFNDETIKSINAALKEAYKRDMRNYSASEEEKLSLAIEKQEKLIEEKRKAGLDTLDDEMELAQLKYDIEVAATNKELALAWKNADEQYTIQKEFIEKQLELATLSAEQRAQLEEELANITAEHSQQKIDQAVDYANQVMDLFSSVDSLMTSISDRQVAKYEKDNAKQKSDLDKRLKAGLISQKDYDKSVEKMDADLDKKKAEIERKAAIRQKAMSAMQIAINTAAAIMKIWAEVPKVDFGASTAVLTALAAATGAIQLAAVLAEPLPQARIGGLVQGPTHEQGGVLINTEGGERIISANPSKAFPELLNLISYIGKHAGIPDTGYGSSILSQSTTQESKEMDYDRLSDLIATKISSALQDLKIYTLITDVRDADKQYTKIENSAKV